MRKTYYYEFEDGYCCWTQGQLKGIDRKAHIRNHGAILIEKIC